MKRKVVALVAVLCLVAVALQAAPRSRYKMAIGAEFGIPVLGGLPSAMLSFRLPNFPAVLGVGAHIPSGGGDASFAIMADWWLWQGNLVSFINMYVGPGLFLGAGSNSFNLGVRVPVGFNAFPIPPLELFIEFAPAMVFVDTSGVNIPNFNLQAGFGFRFWF